MGLQLQLEYLNPTGIMHDSEEVITAEKLKAELRRGLEHKTWEAVHEQSWQGKLTCMRRELRYDPKLRWMFLVAKRLETMPDTCSEGDV